MTKALQLARAFHRAGPPGDPGRDGQISIHRSPVLPGGRCLLLRSRADRSRLRRRAYEIVRYEAVDTFIPVSSPVASVHDARARYVLDGICEVVHATEDVVRMLDDKAEFSKVAVALGLRVPDWVRVTDPQQIVNFNFPAGRSYILKQIAYNPVGRLDRPRLSRRTPQRNAALARWLPISEENPWILQEFIAGREYCTHGTAINGRLQVHVCCESSASQLNYAMVDKPEIRSWVEQFVGALGVTGQFSFDFIEAADGTVYAIECNPRTHSAITTFHNHRQLASAYLEDGHPVITPLDGCPPDVLDLPRAVAAAHPTRTAHPTAQHSARQRCHLRVVGSPAVLDGSPPADPGVADRQPAAAAGAGRRSTSTSASWSNRKATECRRAARPLRLLHLVGSAVDDFHADLSRLYAGACLDALLGRRITPHRSPMSRRTDHGDSQPNSAMHAIRRSADVDVAEAVSHIRALGSRRDDPADVLHRRA